MFKLANSQQSLQPKSFFPSEVLSPTHDIEVSAASNEWMSLIFTASSHEESSPFSDKSFNQVSDFLNHYKHLSKKIISLARSKRLSIKKLYEAVTYLVIGQLKKFNRELSRPNVSSIIINQDNLIIKTQFHSTASKIFQLILKTININQWPSTKPFYFENESSNVFNLKRKKIMTNNFNVASNWKAAGTYPTIFTSFKKKTFNGKAQIMVGMRVLDESGEKQKGLNFFLDLKPTNQSYRNLLNENPIEVEDEVTHEAAVEFFIENFKGKKGIATAKYDEKRGFNHVYQIVSFRTKESLIDFVRDYKERIGMEEVLN